MKEKQSEPNETFLAVSCTVVLKMNNGQQRLLYLTPEKRKLLLDWIAEQHDQELEIYGNDVELLIFE